MVEWWKNVVDFIINGENPALQKSCRCSATRKCHSYKLSISGDIIFNRIKYDVGLISITISHLALCNINNIDSTLYILSQ